MDFIRFTVAYMISYLPVFVLASLFDVCHYVTLNPRSLCCAPLHGCTENYGAAEPTIQSCYGKLHTSAAKLWQATVGYSKLHNFDGVLLHNGNRGLSYPATDAMFAMLSLVTMSCTS